MPHSRPENGHSFTEIILSGGGGYVLSRPPLAVEARETPAPGGAGLAGGQPGGGDSMAAVCQQPPAQGRGHDGATH